MTVGLEASAPGAESQRSDEVRRLDALSLFEARGWSAASLACEPKLAALAALAGVADPEPVARISYRSRGNLLVIAGADASRAREAAARLASTLHVTLLQEAEPTSDEPFAAWSGSLAALTGHLGEFTATLAGLRTADGVRAAGPAPAKFDLVLDFGREPAFAMRQPPQGYYRAPADEPALQGVLAELAEAVGEFEKPKFFAYRENICAHSRSQVEGCSACIEICSTQAISADGDHVKVDPHLCMGCGACATVCPSGAMGYQFPRPSERGAQLKRMLAAYRDAGGEAACLVVHDGAGARELLGAAAAVGSGLPARALPLEAWHVAAVGLDLMLPAIAYGASQVVVLSAGGEDAEYLAALRAQMAIGEAVLAGLGYDGLHFAVIEAHDAGSLAQAFAALAPAAGVAQPATFLTGNDKRAAIEFAVEHLVRHAPRPAEEIALPDGAPFGQVFVDRAKCTMCLACVGACPASALMDGVDVPAIKFLERNCVQCGLCEATCPEEAISLAPRLLLGPAAREARVLNETQPFHCVSCRKPFGTRQMVDAMLGRLAGHSMFSDPAALRRLQMCADCRVVDMMQSRDEVSVLRLGGDA